MNRSVHFAALISVPLLTLSLIGSAHAAPTAQRNGGISAPDATGDYTVSAKPSRATTRAADIAAITAVTSEDTLTVTVTLHDLVGVKKAATNTRVYLVPYVNDAPGKAIAAPSRTVIGGLIRARRGSRPISNSDCVSGTSTMKSSMRSNDVTVTFSHACLPEGTVAVKVTAVSKAQTSAGAARDRARPPSRLTWKW